MAKRRLSIEEHIQLGDKLKNIREELLDISGLVSRRYAQNSTVLRIAILPRFMVLMGSRFVGKEHVVILSRSAVKKG